MTEDASLNPVNIYGQSKAEGERLIEEARTQGIRGSVVRLSNVYGSVLDHPDRVVPAFARNSVEGIALRVDGGQNTFDFTHLDDTVRGILLLATHLEAQRDLLPPIHFLTGKCTSLNQLANLSVELGRGGSTIVHAASRDFDVAHFYGDPSRAKRLLGWEPKIQIAQGLLRLVEDFRLLAST